MFLVLMLLSCWAPTTTGPKGMVGVVTDADGTAVTGLYVTTLEERVKTDLDGNFAIQYKPPEQAVFFRHEGVNYSKRYLTAFDEGKAVPITLPVTGEVTVACHVITPCDLTANWNFARGFSAKLSRRCEPGANLVLTSVPLDPAAYNCGKSDATTRSFVQQRDGEVSVYPPKVRVTVRVAARELPPERCLVLVGGSPAKPERDQFTAFSSGPTIVMATCDGRPANPKVVDVRGVAAEVSLSWGESPSVRPRNWHLPTPPHSLWLVADSADEKSWVLRTHLQDDGAFSIPQLEPGIYHVAISGSGSPPVGYEKPSTTIDAAHLSENVLVISRTKDGVFGSIVVTKPLMSGKVRVQEQ
jgi:hypothetical protein